MVKDADKINFKLKKESRRNVKKLDLNFPILYEDKSCMVINKPAGVSVYPINSADKSSTVIDFVQKMLKAKFTDPKRPGIVHRLDKETSGVLILAKNQAALENLMAQFKAREVKKIYLALVNGCLQHLHGIIDSPIVRSHKHRKKMSLAAEGLGREAISSYKVLDTYRVDHKHVFSLIEVRIFTGRTHQIRVHMSSISHPVIGDVAYGNPFLNRLFIKKFGFRRQFLHSYLIGFRSPATKKEVKVKAELTKELKDLKSKLQA